MQPFITITGENLTTIFGYVGQMFSDAMPFIIVLLAVSIGIIVVSFIINLF
jgi:hypothetical protein